jgi:hypothetical protein
VTLVLTACLGAAQTGARVRLGEVAARATANFRSADSIEARLEAEGATLHPEVVTLRVRIEMALDEARESLANNDEAAASEAVERARALLDRFARRIGGY